MRHALSAAFVSSFALLVVGCSGSSDSSATTETDTGVADTAHVDATGDTGPADTGTADTGKSDAVGDSPTDVPADTGPADIGPDAPADGGGFACGDKTCGADQICTRSYVTGGPCMTCSGPSDCPTGKKCSGGCCIPEVVSYTFACKPKPSGCTTLACGSACESVCGSGCPCEGVSGSTMTCHCLAP